MGARHASALVFFRARRWAWSEADLVCHLVVGQLANRLANEHLAHSAPTATTTTTTTDSQREKKLSRHSLARQKSNQRARGPGNSGRARASRSTAAMWRWFAATSAGCAR